MQIIWKREFFSRKLNTPILITLSFIDTTDEYSIFFFQICVFGYHVILYFCNEFVRIEA